MTTERARILLGKEGIDLTEDQVINIMTKVWYLAETLYEEIDKNGVPADFKPFNK